MNNVDLSGVVDEEVKTIESGEETKNHYKSAASSLSSPPSGNGQFF